MVAVGSVLADRYQLQALVDAGGSGVVWQAMDLGRREVVAVKTYESTGRDAGFGMRYVAENRYLAVISDPGVVPMHGYGYDEPIAWVAMPLLVGESVRTRLARVGAVAPALAMAWLGQAATALRAVHRVGVVHRGLCPSRLFVRADETVVLTDFGLPSGPDLRPAQPAAYLTPEQAMGHQPTVASDVYQLGVIAYECLAGRPPFLAENPLEVAMMHVRQEPPPLPDEVPDAVRHVVARCLAKSPDARWPTADAVAQAVATAGQARVRRGPSFNGWWRIWPARNGVSDR
jgi:serine/threonine-protein kinase